MAAEFMTIVRASPRRVVVITRVLPHYRHRFYELLRTKLERSGIALTVVYGQANAKEQLKRDNAELSWGIRIENRDIKLGPIRLYWQPALKHARGADLIIVEQASRLIINYLLVPQNLLGIRKIAFWGHGRSLHESTTRFGEWLKRVMSRRVHWWFAYNGISEGIVRQLGFPTSRITNVQNSIDTRRLAQLQSEITPDELDEIRRESGLHGDNICIYIGGMYREKRLDYLIEACELIRRRVPDFEMIFVGAGTDDWIVAEATRRHAWIHYVGPQFDRRRAAYLKLSKLLLMPGLVGLAVLDSFAMGTPLITTGLDIHSPEIEYLESGINGLIVEESDEPSAYANAVAQLLEDGNAREVLVQGCVQASDRYSVEEMVDRFAEGVVMALASR